MGLKMLSLFSGVGMIDLAASWAGIETVAVCEIQPYPQQILKKRFPEVKVYDDIFNITAEKLKNDGITKVDIVAGGFPCQPFSVAGNREGEEDERHLWPEMCRVIRELKPRWVLGENVPGLLSIADVSGRRGGTFGSILRDLAEMGHDAIWSVYGANEIGAPHKRERVFILANSVSERRNDGGDNWQGGYIPNDAERSAKENKSEWDEWQYRTSQVGANDGNLWATPSAADATGNHGGGQHKSLRTDVYNSSNQLWPTPQARDYRSGDNPDSPRQGRKAERGWSNNLNDVVKLWGTPRACDYKGCCQYGTPRHAEELKRGNLKGEVMEPNNKGQLNPDWVEILMGLPIGWTDIDCDNPKPFPGWPAGMSEEQYDYEPPRAAENIKNRAARIKACGNGCVPQQVYPIFVAIAEIEKAKHV